MDQPSQDLTDLVRCCTVRLVDTGGAQGTGFFIAPGVIATCAHVVEIAWERAAPVDVHWRGQAYQARIDAFLAKPYPDLALLRLDWQEHPCVYLNDSIELRDSLYSWGFSDPENYPHGDSATFTYEGPTQARSDVQQTLLKLKEGQAWLGLSGAPVLNLRTGGVCGIVKSTRDRSTDLGGRAVPITCIPAEHNPVALQQHYHQRHPDWLDCLNPQQRKYIPRPPAPSYNPFYGESPTLLGRSEEIRRILDKLRAGNHCSIIGPSGSGKSFLLKELEKQARTQLGCRAEEIYSLSFRLISNLTELKAAIVTHLGGQKASEINSLLRRKPPRLLLLDDLGGMEPGERGLWMRRRLRGLGDQGIKLVMVSNERLEILFRRDDPNRDSPLAGLDPVPVELAPLSADLCQQLVQQRLTGMWVDINHFAELFSKPWQPRELLIECVKRYEELHRTKP